MWQSYNAHPRRELVVSGRFNDILKVESSDMSRDDLRVLASNHKEANTRIVLRTRYATVRATVRLTFCAVTQMFLSPYWHTGKIFVKTYGCFLELLEGSGTFQFT